MELTLASDSWDQVPVSSEEDTLAQFFAGEQMRSTAPHMMNRNSSRSHCIFTIHVEMRHSLSASEKAVVSKLHLVDLAGSERTKRTNPTGAFGSSLFGSSPVHLAILGRMSLASGRLPSSPLPEIVKSDVGFPVVEAERIIVGQAMVTLAQPSGAERKRSPQL